MADFRQLALEFVLQDDPARLAAIAQNAASELASAPATGNPVARWVEAVQPWMPGSDDDEMQRDADTPDWSSRAKALEFLSRTIDFLDPDLLKPSQVKLLVAFFGAMFDVDHKAGIKASATALSRILAMKAFQPQSAQEIVQKVCTLQQDFPRQLASTRLAVYELLRRLVTDPAIASDLQRRDPNANFAKDLLTLCQNERDPDCLMVWFGLLRHLLAHYSLPHDVLQEIYAAFKTYFPITLPRTSQSKVQPAELKLALRQCFAANHGMAPLAFAFLLEKLDQGDGVTVNVKVDILQTIDMCLEKYNEPGQSIVPYVNRIWGSLKYEVRNGEVEDTISATLEVMRTLATRLRGDELREFTLTVTRDCVSDLSNPTYTAAAGRLLVSVLSASTTAFVLMVAPTVTHIKENLRHPKSPVHGQDMHRILHIVLETRLLLTGVGMTDGERADFAAVDPVFTSLYADVYSMSLNVRDASYDDIKLATEAVQGVGALVCQTIPQNDKDMRGSHLLLPRATCTEICNALFQITALPLNEPFRKASSDELVNESIRALARSVQAYPQGYQPLMEQAAAAIRRGHTDRGAEVLSMAQRICSVLAVAGFSDARPSQANALRNFVAFMCMVRTEFIAAMDARADPDLWYTLVNALLVALEYFDGAFGELLADYVWSDRTAVQPWLQEPANQYPEWKSLGVGDKPAADQKSLPFEMPDFGRSTQHNQRDVAQLNEDGLLVALDVCRAIFRRCTKPVMTSDGAKGLALDDALGRANVYGEARYLHQLSKLASCIVEKMTKKRLACPNMEMWALTLFREEDVSITLGAGQSASWDSLIDWLVFGPLSVLCAGVLRSLPVASVTQLYEMGVAQRILVRGTSPVTSLSDSATLPSTRCILGYLANKYKVEALPETMEAIEKHLAEALAQASSGQDEQERDCAMERALTCYVVVGALVPRCTGKQTQRLLQQLREAPNSAVAGYRLAHGLDIIAGFSRAYYSGAGVMKPLWKQKLYFDLVQPMMTAGIGGWPAVQDALIKTNYAIAALVMLREMPFAIYEDDSAKVVRAALLVAQKTGVGADARIAMEVLKHVLDNAPEALQDHLRSLINVCIGLFSTRRRPECMSEGYAAPPAEDGETEAACGKLALEMVGGLPRLFESRHVVPFVAQVQRALATACGHRVRDVRKRARLARAAWADAR